MSITMLPSACSVFLLAYIGYGVLLQPVECMPSMYPSPTDNSGNLKSTQLATMQSREDPLKILFRMFLDAEKLAKKRMNNRQAVTQQYGIGCYGINPPMCGIIGPCGCPPQLDADAIERLLQTSKEFMPNPSKQVMIARSKKRGQKHPMMRGKKKKRMHKNNNMVHNP